MRGLPKALLRGILNAFIRGSPEGVSKFLGLLRVCPFWLSLRGHHLVTHLLRGLLRGVMRGLLRVPYNYS